MSSRYLLSPAAQAHLEEIWDCTYDRWGVDQAEQYLRELQHAIDVLRQTRGSDERATRFAPAIASSRPGHTRCSIG